MKQVPDSFSAFLVPGCDRCSFIRQYLQERGVRTSIVPLGQRKHIYVNFPGTSYSPLFKMKTVLAHYDRVEGSPGANDNSAAVFELMDWAVTLSGYGGVHNIRLFFTDGEEFCGSGGVSAQGAYGLAELFKKLSITDDDVYVFDCCGRGDVPVVAKTNFIQKIPASFLKKISALAGRAETIVRTASPQKWLTLPVSYSDNAGFLACGIPAVAITILPREEAEAYMYELVRTKDLEAVVMNREKEVSSLPEFVYREKLPKTWRLLHTEYDDIASLTPNSFALMENILNILAGLKTLS